VSEPSIGRLLLDVAFIVIAMTVLDWFQAGRIRVRPVTPAFLLKVSRAGRRTPGMDQKTDKHDGVGRRVPATRSRTSFGRRRVHITGPERETATCAAGIGFSWGSGTLRYEGKTYPVKVDGLAVGEVGVSRAAAVGAVKNLKKLSDFSGNYVAAGAGATAGGGADVAVMRNQNGVVIEMKSPTQGANLKLGVAGVRLTLAK